MNYPSSFPCSRPSHGRLASVVFILSIVGLCLCDPASADVCDPCRIYVMPGSTSVVFPLSGLVAEPTDAVTPVTSKTVDDLQHGRGVYDIRAGLYTYTPEETFWSTGIDQATFRIDSPGSAAVHRSVIFLSGSTHVFYERDFNFTQAADLSAWTVFPEPNPGEPAAYLSLGSQGGYLVVPSTPGVDVGVGDGGNQGQNEAHVASLGGQTEGSATPPPTWAERLEKIFDISDIVSIEKKTLNGVNGEETFARGRINPDYFLCVPRDEDPHTLMPCETGWLDVTDPENQLLVVEVGHRILGVDIPRPWSLQFSVEDSGGNQLGFDEVWTDLEAPLPAFLETQVGSMSVSSPESATHKIKRAYSYASSFSGNAAIFREDFNELTASGLTSGAPEWITEGFEAQYADGLFSAGSGGEDELALFADLTKLIPRAFPSNYVVSGEAGDRTAIIYEALNLEDEVRLKMSVRTRPSGASQVVEDYYPAWTSFEMLRIGKFDGTPDFGPVSIRFATDNVGTRRFLLKVYGNSGGVFLNEWVTSPNQKVALSLYWKRNTNGPNNPNGEVRLVVDGQEIGISGIDNSGQVGEYVALGAWDLSLVKLPATQLLPFGFDDIVIVGDENSGGLP